MNNGYTLPKYQRGGAFYMGTRVSYPYEVKMKAIEMRLAGIPVKQVLEELNIKNYTQLKTWMKWYREGEIHRLHQPVAGSIPTTGCLIRCFFTVSKTVLSADGGYEHYGEKVEGHVTREHPSESFDDYYSQTRMFWNSLSKPERNDLIESFSFHLGSVESKKIRQWNVEMWANVDEEMAKAIADNIGVDQPKTQHVDVEKSYLSLSQLNTPSLAETQKVGVLIGQAFTGEEVEKAWKALKKMAYCLKLSLKR